MMTQIRAGQWDLPRRILEVVRMHTIDRGDPGFCPISQEKFARWLSPSGHRRTIQRALDRLVSDRVLYREERGPGYVADAYRINGAFHRWLNVPWVRPVEEASMVARDLLFLASERPIILSNGRRHERSIDEANGRRHERSSATINGRLQRRSLGDDYRTPIEASVSEGTISGPVYISGSLNEEEEELRDPAEVLADEIRVVCRNNGGANFRGQGASDLLATCRKLVGREAEAIAWAARVRSDSHRAVIEDLELLARRKAITKLKQNLTELPDDGPAADREEQVRAAKEARAKLRA